MNAIYGSVSSTRVSLLLSYSKQCLQFGLSVLLCSLRYGMQYHESVCSIVCPETPAYFLFDFNLSDSPLAAVVVVRDIWDDTEM